MSMGNIVTIGSFDGVHRGHAALLDRAVLEAQKRRMKVIAVTFLMPPKMVLNPTLSHDILSHPVEKKVLMRRHHIDTVKFLEFDRKRSRQKPFHFFRETLIKELKAKGVVIGSNFRFGFHRSAGALEMVLWGEKFGIPVWVIDSVKDRGNVISSSKIRDLIHNGRFQTMTRYLGHPFLIGGNVVSGRGVGKKLGFATLNLRLKNKALPRGVFVVQGWSPSRWGADNSSHLFYGVCNIGTRPTFLKHSPVVVEIHVLKGLEKVKGKTVFIELLHKLRNEKKFPSKETLVDAINRDVKRSFLYIKKHVVKTH